MITAKELKQSVLAFSQKGASAVADNLDCEIVPFDGVVDAVIAQFGVAGVDGTGAPTQDVQYDIKKNGTSIVGATKISWAHAANGVAPSSYGTLVGAAPIAVSKGDVLSLQCVQILNGTSPTQPINASFRVRISRVRGGGNPAQIITGAVSEV